MADAITIEIAGLREIQAKLQQLPNKIANRVVLSSLRAGANIVKKQIQANAPVRTGALRKGFKVSRSKIHRAPSDLGVYLTLKKGRGRSDPKDAFYGRWVEGGYKRGRAEIPGKFFIQRAFDATKEEAVSTIVAAAETKIDEITNDVGR